MPKFIAGHYYYVPPDNYRSRLKVVPKPAKVVKLVSVFDYHSGTIELYMDDELIKIRCYTDKCRRRKILIEWEIWMRNFYSKRIFYIHIKPNEK